MSFIDGNQIMLIENEGRHIKFKFLNVCTKAEPKFQKISSCYNMAFLNQSVDKYLQKRTNSFSVSNSLYN